MGSTHVTLLETENQARGLGEFALQVLAGKFPAPSPQALERVEWFHTDSLACSVSALALGTNAPTVLREEALEYAVPAGKTGATCLGSQPPRDVTGDVTQTDLPRGQKSGLRAVEEILDEVDDISFNRLTSHDVVRHKLVGRIVAAYDEHEARIDLLRAQES